jgi:hypothetical protein
MSTLTSQIRRFYSDDGRDDRDFTHQAARLREARTKMHEGADLLGRVSERLRSLIIDRQGPELRRQANGR